MTRVYAGDVASYRSEWEGTSSDCFIMTLVNPILSEIASFNLYSTRTRGLAQHCCRRSPHRSRLGVYQALGTRRTDLNQIRAGSPCLSWAKALLPSSAVDDLSFGDNRQLPVQ